MSSDARPARPTAEAIRRPGHAPAGRRRSRRTRRPGGPAGSLGVVRVGRRRGSGRRSVARRRRGGSSSARANPPVPSERAAIARTRDRAAEGGDRPGRDERLEGRRRAAQADPDEQARPAAAGSGRCRTRMTSRPVRIGAIAAAASPNPTADGELGTHGRGPQAVGREADHGRGSDRQGVGRPAEARSAGRERPVADRRSRRARWRGPRRGAARPGRSPARSGRPGTAPSRRTTARRRGRRSRASRTKTAPMAPARIAMAMAASAGFMARLDRAPGRWASARIPNVSIGQ